MKKHLSAFIIGILFGLGLTVSQMVNPAKVLGFLDILGNWDPSLAFVMGAALIVTYVGYRFVWRMKKPLLEDRFQVPGHRHIDTRLASGAILFGVGWGLVGLCPGPAIAAISIGGQDILIFMAAMIIGMMAFDLSPLKKG